MLYQGLPGTNRSRNHRRCCAKEAGKKPRWLPFSLIVIPIWHLPFHFGGNRTLVVKHGLEIGPRRERVVYHRSQRHDRMAVKLGQASKPRARDECSPPLKLRLL